MDVEDLHTRFKYHPADTDAKRAAHSKVRYELLSTALIVADVVPEGREYSLFVTKLEEAMFWANAGIARSGGR